MRRSASLFASSALALLAFASDSRAFVPIPVGGHPGEIDLGGRVILERGKVEPTANPASFRGAEWEMYSLGGGYTYGDIGVLQDTFIRLEGTYYRTPDEVNDLESGSVDPALCLGEVVGPGRCQFHAADAGGFVTAAVGFNAIHKADFSLGFFLQGMLPIGVNFAKFEAPRLDLVAGGTQVGVHLTRWLGFENRIYVGSGVPRDERAKHNAAIAVTTLFSLEAERWILPWKAGIKFGPYIDGDLTDRVDERYEQAFTAGYPDRRDPVRALRYAAAVMPYFLVTDHLAVELGIVQKIFGADVPATRAMWAGLRGVFDTRPRPAPRPAPAPKPAGPVPTPSG